MPTSTQSADITLQREYDAPIDAVWQAWADPEQIKEWWGPRGFTITTESRDLRSGGIWKYTMHGPDGVDYANYTKYIEVENQKKLVYDHGATEGGKGLFKVTVIFTPLKSNANNSDKPDNSDKSDKTRMDMTMTFESAEAAQTSRGFIKKAGGDATWDRLAEYLEKKLHDKEVFVINRSFDAPIEKIFDMWTNPAHVQKWLPPTGFDMQYKTCDIKPGGKAFYSMSNGSVTMYGRCQYLQIEKPDHIVYTQQFCDENENVSRHPMAPTWPEDMLTDVRLTAENKDVTLVTVTWQPHGSFTAEELEVVIQARGGMTQGWTGSFDKLEEYLQNQ